MIFSGNNMVGTTMAIPSRRGRQSRALSTAGSLTAYSARCHRRYGDVEEYLRHVLSRSPRCAWPLRCRSSATELDRRHQGPHRVREAVELIPIPGREVFGTPRHHGLRLIVSDAALETMSKFRPDLLRGVASMAAEAVRSADAAEYWRIPLTGQRDPVTATRLAALMLEHSVEVFTSGGQTVFSHSHCPALWPFCRRDVWHSALSRSPPCTQ